MTTKIYKLTDHNLQTHGGYQWVLGEWREATGTGGLCSDGMLHCYSHPLLAVLLNPIHADISDPRLFEGEGTGERTDDGMKQGFRRMRIVRELPLPSITTEQRVRFAILCTLEVYEDAAFATWANAWLDGSDRSARAADAAADAAAHAAADAAADAACAARAATYADAWAAAHAAHAADAAAWAAAARAARAAHAAARAADAAAHAAACAAAHAADAARAAAHAARAAAHAEKPLDLVVLATRVVEEDWHDNNGRN